MAKLTAWLTTLIGLILVLNMLDIGGIGSVITSASGLSGWVLALAVLIIGIGKLMRNYKKRR